MKPTVTFDAHRVLCRLAAVGGMLIVACVLTQVATQVFRVRIPWQITRMVELNNEMNLPTYFSAFLMALVALSCKLVGHVEKVSLRRYWGVLSAGFMLMSVDEVCSMHERLGAPMRNLMGPNYWPGFHFAWIIPGAGLVLVLGAYFIRFLRMVPRHYARSFMLAGACFLGGALGMEMLGGWYSALHGRANLPYLLLADIEECMELGGLLLFLRAVWQYGRQAAPALTIEIPADARELRRPTALPGFQGELN